MPISISNLAQLLLFKIKTTASRHKKKLILLLVLLLAGYIAKKKLTIAHILTFIQLLTKAVQALPLPEAPKLRNIAEYEHPHTVPMKAILEATNLDELKRKISKKEAGWQDLKQAVTTCAVLSLVFYNSSSLYFLAQNKYREEFVELGGSTQFQQAMYETRRQLIQQMPLIFSSIRIALIEQFGKIELSKAYDVEELESYFKAMVDKVLQFKFDISKEPTFCSLSKASPFAANMFTSPYEYMPPKPSLLSKAGSVLAKFIGGIFKVGELLPTPKIEITNERFLFVKNAYLQPLKKAAASLETTIEWPNQDSKELFQLVIEQMQFMLLSVNFSTLLKSYTVYNLKILLNRIRLLYAQKQKTKIKYSQFLPLLNKIMQEEFFKHDLMEHRDKYHNVEVKKALRIVSQLEGDQAELPAISIEEHILEEIQLKQAFQFLEKELELKFFNERSGVVMRPKSASGEHEAEEMKKLLSMMGSSQILNDQG